MDDEYTCDGKFEGNTLIVGQTGCGKTKFIQNLAKNRMFGNLREIYWIIKVPLSDQREKNIPFCFQKHVGFKYPQTVDEFNMELTFIQRQKNVDNDSVMGENNIFDKLIVMDDVSGLADKSDNFANFLTISRKFSFTCVYDFHTMYPTKSSWQMILSQTKFFNIFPGSWQTTSVVKILSSYYNRYTYEYMPHRDLWLNRLYFEISKSSEIKCLTIDIRDVNNLGQSKFRTVAENDKEQTCYNKKDRVFNRFLAIRRKTPDSE